MLFVKVKSVAIHVSKERAQEFISLCQAHAEASRKDAGNIEFKMKYLKLPGAVKVTFVELWKDRDALDKHNEASKSRGHIAKINEIRDYREVLERETEE